MLVNRLGQDWLLIRAWADDQIVSALSALELSDERGDMNRGRLAILRLLIETVEPPPKTETEDENYG